MDEKCFGRLETEILAEYENKAGVGALLATRICGVRIAPKGIANAFADMINGVVTEDGSFRISDLLSLWEKQQFSKNPCGRDGQAIISVSGGTTTKVVASKVLSNSLNGVYELIARTPGFAIDISSFDGCDINSLSQVRFMFCAESKAALTLRELNAAGLYAVRIGTVDGGGRIAIVKGDETLCELPREVLFGNSNEAVSIDIGSDCAAPFRAAFIETIRYAALASARCAKAIVLKNDGRAEALLSSLLGVYAAQRSYGVSTVRLGFSKSDTHCSFMPCSAAEGDIAAILSANCDSAGYPRRESTDRINGIIRNAAQNGIITGLIPLCNTVEEAESALNSGLKLALDESADVSFKDGAVLVLTRGEALGRPIGSVVKCEVGDND